HRAGAVNHDHSVSAGVIRLRIADGQGRSRAAGDINSVQPPLIGRYSVARRHVKVSGGAGVDRGVGRLADNRGRIIVFHPYVVEVGIRSNLRPAPERTDGDIVQGGGAAGNDLPSEYAVHGPINRRAIGQSFNFKL